MWCWRRRRRRRFDQFWVSNDLFLRSAPVILSAIALATSRIELGSCILNPYTIHPSEIGHARRDADEQAAIAFNQAWRGARRFPGLGRPVAHASLATVRATITTIRALLRGERGPFAGRLGSVGRGRILRFHRPRA